MQASGYTSEAKHLLQALFEYLDCDMIGRQANRIAAEDSAQGIDALQSQKRLDIRSRWFNLRAMRRTLARRRRASVQPG